jgi:DNA-directed RNA polymerase subunit M/transcription elongation factor TFIIS
MVIITTPDDFKYQCEKCQTFENPSEKDTLVHEDVTGTNLVIYKSILHNAGKDPVNPKVMRKCKCGSNYAKQVRLGDEMKLINTCVDCGTQWLDGTKDDDSDVTGSSDSHQVIRKSGVRKSTVRKSNKSSK